MNYELSLIKSFGTICDDVINWKDGLVQPQIKIRYCMAVIGNRRVEQVNQTQGDGKIGVIHARMKVEWLRWHLEAIQISRI